jgi:hypothetical protein
MGGGRLLWWARAFPRKYQTVVEMSDSQNILAYYDMDLYYCLYLLLLKLITPATSHR